MKKYWTTNEFTYFMIAMSVMFDDCLCVCVCLCVSKQTHILALLENDRQAGELVTVTDTRRRKLLAIVSYKANS